MASVLRRTGLPPLAPLKNLLLDGLSSGEKALLEPYFEPVQLDVREQLTESGVPIAHVWFPQDAIASTIVTTQEGGVTEAGLMGSDGMVGLSLLLETRESNATVIVQVPGLAMRMHATDFLQHVVRAKSPFYHRLLRYLNGFISMILQTTACNGLHSVEERTARWILMVRDRIGRDTFPLTEEFLALTLGVGRQTVSGIAASMQREGVLAFRHGMMTIEDRAALERDSCDCYANVRAIMARSTE